jgi:hypothetical protein
MPTEPEPLPQLICPTCNRRVLGKGQQLCEVCEDMKGRDVTKADVRNWKNWKELKP